MSEVSKNLGVSRGAIYKKSVKKRGPYEKKKDVEILPLIQSVLETRSTYGYKRITAMVNRGLAKKINKKRVYRIMKNNGLLLPKTKTSRTHTGTGKVMTLHSNTRWCSDGFEIKCFNGEKVYVAFSLDCCDREVIAYVAKKEPLTAKDVQQLMIESVEKRFTVAQTPRKIEWLTDRGAIYRASNVQQLARWLGLQPCYTAAYSPSSNGMAESFVGTFKRDYVYVSDCYSADQVIKQLQGWFDDYNNVAPHSALDMRTPSEFKKAVNN